MATEPKPRPSDDREARTRGRRLSVITAVHPPRSRHLPATATSVSGAREHLAQVGVDLEWLVVIDGPGRVPTLPDDAWVRVVRRPMNGGVSAARNTGLALATGDLVMPLDHDDQLDPLGLRALLSDPRSHDAAWCAGSPRLLDGSWTAHRVQQARQWRPRELEEHWTAPFPFHPNAILADRALALAVGGWPALTGNQDLGFAFALNRVAPGWSLPHCVIRYRVWDEQTVSQGFYPRLKELDFAFLAAHLNADRAHAGLPSVVPPASGGSHVVGDASR